MKQDRHRNAASKRVANFKGNLLSDSPSIILFLSVIILVNLCSFQSDFQPNNIETPQPPTSTMQTELKISPTSLSGQVESCLKFVKLMFTNPIRLGRRSSSFTLAEAKMLGKVAKAIYLKKKIKKFGKKLKKKTIAVPVFTAIPIYEHSYYPAPHVTHMTHHGGHMHAAANSPVASAQQLDTSASRAVPTYRMSMYHGGASPIINAYSPSPPVFVDDTGGLYGHYGNAYGRYDGGYHMW